MFWKVILAKSFLMAEDKGNIEFYKRLISYWTMMLTVAGLASGFVFTSTFTVPSFRDLPDATFSIRGRENVFGTTTTISFILSLVSCITSLLFCCLFAIAGEEEARKVALRLFKMRVIVDEQVQDRRGVPTVVRRVRVESAGGCFGTALRQEIVDIPPLLLGMGLTAMVPLIIV